MLVLDALFDHIQQISSNVEIIGILVQFAQFRQLMSELGQSRRIDTAPAVAACPLHLRQRLNFGTGAKWRFVPLAS